MISLERPGVWRSPSPLPPLPVATSRHAAGAIRRFGEDWDGALMLTYVAQRLHAARLGLPHGDDREAAIASALHSLDGSAHEPARARWIDRARAAGGAR
jgi:hypothetical protein